MERTHLRSIRNGARKFSQFLPEPLDSPCVRYSAIFFFVGSIKVAAAALRDFNRRMVVFTRDLHHQVVDSARPNLQARLRQRSLTGHLRTEPRVRIASRRGIHFNLGAAEAS